MIIQLVNIYLNEEDWHKSKLSREEAIKYFKKLRKNCIICCDNEKVIGYLEFWRINFPQLERILLNNFSAYEEDVESGYICYVANTWIHPQYRNGDTYKLLKNRLLERNKDCQYFVGEKVKGGRKLKIHRR